jgi:hypothetical protein
MILLKFIISVTSSNCHYSPRAPKVSYAPLLITLNIPAALSQLSGKVVAHLNLIILIIIIPL